MKTILIAHNYSLESVSAISYSLAHYLAGKGCTVVFISFRPHFKEVQEIPCGAGKIFLYSWSSNRRPTGLRDFRWFTRIYFKHRPTIVLGHFVGNNIAAMMSKLLSLGRASTYAYYHTLASQLIRDSKQNSLQIRLFCFRKQLFYKFFVDRVICPSDLAKNDILERFHVRDAHVVYNALADRFSGLKQEPDGNIVLSFLGRFSQSKGVLELIGAFNNYCEQYPGTRVILNLAGAGELEKQIKDLIVSNHRIRYVGRLGYEKVDEYLGNSHFAIIPSINDAFNMVGIEAMMNQTPLLISSAVGLSNYLAEGETCYKFEPTLADIVRVIGHAESHIGDQPGMGENARRAFLQKFSMDTYCTTMERLLGI